MTDDELLRWAAEDVLGWLPNVWHGDSRWLTESAARRFDDDLLGWPGFGLAVTEIERRGWGWTIWGPLEDRCIAVDVFSMKQPDFDIEVTDGNYAVAAWRALYQAMEATK